MKRVTVVVFLTKMNDEGRISRCDGMRERKTIVEVAVRRKQSRRARAHSMH